MKNFIKDTLEELQKLNVELSFDFKKSLTKAEQIVLTKYGIINSYFLEKYVDNGNDLLELLDFILKLKKLTRDNVKFDENTAYSLVQNSQQSFFIQHTCGENTIKWLETEKFVSLFDHLPSYGISFIDLFSTIVFSLLLKKYRYTPIELSQDITKIVEIKNAVYGSAVLNPHDYFVYGTSDFLIKLQMNNKLSRILSAEDDNEDAYFDLLGYYYLLTVATTTN